MHQLVVQLIEPSVIDAPWLADVWLFTDKMTLIISERQLEVSRIDAWVQAQLSEGNSKAYIGLIALAPAARSHSRLLTISKGQQRYINDIVPSLMESFLAQPIEDIHFVTRVIDSETVQVSAVDREYMVRLSQIVTMIDAVEKRLILPQSLLYNELDEEECVSFLGINYHLSNGHLFSLPIGLSSHLNAPNKILNADFLREALLAIKSWRGVNLFEREFVQQSHYQQSARRWKVAGLLFATMLVASCGWLHYESLVYQEQATYIENKANKAFLALAPEEGRVVNLQRQIEGRLRDNKLEQKTDNQEYSPYFVLSKLGQAKQEIKGENELRLIAFREGIYILEWAAADQETPAQLSKIFAKLKLNAYLDQVVRVDKLYLGSYRIQGAL